MTDQPTTWTQELEQALKRVIKDVDTINLSRSTQKLREAVGAALESAAAEIAKEKARADTAEKEAEGLMLHVERTEKEIDRLRAELAAKQPETRTPLPEAHWVKIPLQHESGLTTWNGKWLRDLSAAEFEACKADAERGIGSMEALLGVAEEARVRRALAKAEPAKAEAAQQGPSDEEIPIDVLRRRWRECYQSPELAGGLPLQARGGEAVTTDQLTGRALDEAAARAMGWRDGWWRFGGTQPTEREMLAHLTTRGVVEMHAGARGATVKLVNVEGYLKGTGSWIGTDLREALARLVVAVAAREAKA